MKMEKLEYIVKILKFIEFNLLFVIIHLSALYNSFPSTINNSTRILSSSPNSFYILFHSYSQWPVKFLVHGSVWAL